jgi:low temperature requirement protein LtrA
MHMGDRRAERGRVTPLELFFDLVVVFAITQVTAFLSRDPAWASYAWLTNTLDPEEGAVRLAVFAAVAAMLVVSLAVPGAFGPDGVTFGVAYLVVRGVHLVLFAIAGRGDRELFRATMRILPGSILAPLLLVVAGLVDGSAQLALWGAALAILYLGPLRGSHARIPHLAGALRRTLRADHHDRAGRVDRGDRGRRCGAPAR